MCHSILQLTNICTYVTPQITGITNYCELLHDDFWCMYSCNATYLIEMMKAQLLYGVPLLRVIIM